MKKYRQPLGLTLAAVVLFAGLLPSASAMPGRQNKPDPQLVARLARMIGQSGYVYKTIADNVWLVSFKGSSLTNIQVIVSSAENLIVMGVIVAKKDSLKVTPEMMFKLLRLVHDMDRVKIGFDDDEDLFVRAEVTAKCFELAEFKEQIEQVAAASDKVHANIKAYLAK